MRHYILIFLLTFSLFGYSQIGKTFNYENFVELGKVERYLGDTYALYTLSYIELDSKTKYYVLTFTNERTLYDKDKSPDIRSLGFKANQQEFDYFYTFLQQGFLQDHIRSIEVGQDLVKTITTGSKYLHINIDFLDGESASFRVSKNQLAKLFGKK